jgi:hypothetical protein
MAVTNLTRESTQPVRPAGTSTSPSSGQHNEHDDGGLSIPPAPMLAGKKSQSLPDRSIRRHSLPSHILLQTNASPSASLVEAEQAPRGEHTQIGEAHRISALRQLNGATNNTGGHRYAKSTGARNTTFSQPVIVSTYSGGMRPRSTTSRSSHTNGVSASQNGKGKDKAGSKTDMGKAELPPVEAFSFKGIMESIHSNVADDLERIAEICARSSYSLANQHEAHMPPHGDGSPFTLYHHRDRPHAPGAPAAAASHENIPGPTLEAIMSSDDEHSRGSNTRPPRGGPGRRRSKAYGTLETIYSSSKSSEKEKAKKKGAKELAEEVRGRVEGKMAARGEGTTGGDEAIRAGEGRGGTGEGGEERSNPRLKAKRARSHGAVGFASLLIDSTTHASFSAGASSSRRHKSLSLISSPAAPRTVVAEQDLSLGLPTVEDGDPFASQLAPAGQGNSVLLAEQQQPLHSSTATSVFLNLATWLPWSSPSPARVSAQPPLPTTPQAGHPRAQSVSGGRRASHAEGSLRSLLDGVARRDSRGQGVTRSEAG